MVRITTGYTDEGKQIMNIIGYYATKKEALSALAEHNENPYSAMPKDISFEKVFEDITRNVVQETVSRNESLPPTEAIKITTMAGCSAVKGK